MNVPFVAPGATNVPFSTGKKLRPVLVGVLGTASVAAIVIATPAAVAAQPASVLASGGDLASPEKKEIAMELVSSAENSSLNWKTPYKYIEDNGDGRGYTAGIIGFCSGTGPVGGRSTDSYEIK